MRDIYTLTWAFVFLFLFMLCQHLQLSGQRYDLDWDWGLILGCISCVINIWILSIIVTVEQQLQLTVCFPHLSHFLLCPPSLGSQLSDWPTLHGPINMSTDDSISEDVSSSGALSHCHASADGDGGKESETSLVSSEGTSASGLAVSEERHTTSQTTGGTVQSRPVDITPACNKIRYSVRKRSTEHRTWKYRTEIKYETVGSTTIFLKPCSHKTRLTRRPHVTQKLQPRLLLLWCIRTG